MKKKHDDDDSLRMYLDMAADPYRDTQTKNVKSCLFVCFHKHDAVVWTMCPTIGSRVHVYCCVSRENINRIKDKFKI